MFKLKLQFVIIINIEMETEMAINKEIPIFEFKEISDDMTPEMRQAVNRKNQSLAIKERLNYLLERSSFKKRSQLLAELSNSKDFFPFNRNTFLATFDPKSNTLDLYAVLAIGRYFNVDMDLLFASPNLTIDRFRKELELEDKNTVRNLNDYKGTYHCFMPSFNIRHRELVPCTLIISDSDGHLEASFTYQSKYIDLNDVEKEVRLTFRGKPILVKRSRNIYALMTSETGDYLFLSFSYQQYNTSGLYYRRGIVVSSESVSQDPIFMNMVLFPNRIQGEEKMPLIRGLLRIMNEKHQPYLISGNDLAELENDPTMKAYLDTWGSREEACVRIDEGRILYDIYRESDEAKMRTMQALLRLRNYSGMTDRMVYPTDTPYSEFTKKFLIKKTDSENPE